MSANCTSTNFTTSIFTTLWGFFQSLIGILEADFEFLLNWTGSRIVFLFTAWGSSMSAYGPWVIAMLVVSIGSTIMGLYLVFVFMDAGKGMVGE